MNRYVAEADFNAADSSQVSFKKNDVIEVLSKEDDWWYGQIVSSGLQGWLPPSYVRATSVEIPSPVVQQKFDSLPAQYSGMNARDKLVAAETVLSTIIDSELKFVNKLKVFIDACVTPLQVKDTAFKRDFMNEYSLAVCFSLMNDMVQACGTFVAALQTAHSRHQNNLSKSAKSIATCITEFSPSLRIFASFISENSNALNSLKGHRKGLNLFLQQHALPVNCSIETFLVLPVEHYSTYSAVFSQWVQLCVGASLGTDTGRELERAERAFLGAAEEGDAKLAAEKEKHLLLAVQSQCELD
jgi:hypothetical protein